jgi:hypothetical protein
MAQFASLAGHYGQLIGSRTDVLLKQLQVQCNLGDQWSEVRVCMSRKSTHPDKLNWWNPAARRLATLEYLRDSTADEHMQQFRWLKLDPDGVNTMSVDEAVRASRMLFENNYWTNVNRVSASGRGEVRMALIKDDIGNWSLKSFDNNPEELLGAYRDATVAGIGALAKIARKGTMPAGDAIIGFASSLAQGKVAPQGSSGNVDQGIASARTDLLAALTEIETELSTASVAIKKDEDEAKTAVSDAETKVTGANKAVATNEALVSAFDAVINDPPADMSVAQIEQLASKKAKAQADLAAAQATQSLSNAELNEAKAKLALVAERRANAGQRAIEKAQLELKAYQRALTAIRKMAASASAPAAAAPALPSVPSLPAPGG